METSRGLYGRRRIVVSFWTCDYKKSLPNRKDVRTEQNRPLSCNRWIQNEGSRGRRVHLSSPAIVFSRKPLSKQRHVWNGTINTTCSRIRFRRRLESVRTSQSFRSGL